MSAVAVEFDAVAYDAQIKAWLKEGFTEEDILAQAQHTWPSLPAGYSQATIRHLKSRTSRKKHEPAQGLLKIHHKRVRHLQMIEERLKATDAPISLHSLYRGLLRDHEAACHKMLEVKKRRFKDVPSNPNWSKIVKRKTQVASKLKQQEQAILTQLEQQQLAKEASGTKTRNSMSSLIAGLIIFLLSLLLAGASSCTRDSSTNLYTVARPFPAQGNEDVHRQRTSQLFAAPAEDHQALLQRAANDSA
ncbi:MAG TPA: hypothetical protein PLN21_13740 [Gemmatales bacterium]|nr:hypothetical protein [Gemmatales bacterium]